MAEKSISEILIEAISNPKKVETAEGRVEERSVSELLNAVAAIQQSKEEKQTVPWGMVYAQHVPGGEY